MVMGERRRPLGWRFRGPQASLLRLQYLRRAGLGLPVDHEQHGQQGLSKHAYKGLLLRGCSR